MNDMQWIRSPGGIPAGEEGGRGCSGEGGVAREREAGQVALHDLPFSQGYTNFDAQSRELEEQLEKLQDRLTEASSEGGNWRSNEQEDVTECQYQVRVARKNECG